MKKKELSILIAGLLSLGLMNVHAKTPTVDLGESTIHSGYVEVNRLKADKEVIVITKKDIQSHGYENLEDILKDVPSINVGLTGPGDIDIRGQGAEQAQRNIQVMLDGAPITTLTSHPYSNNYNYIPVQNIEKIEIIPGGGSVMYGSGASGGVINITTNLHNIQKPDRHITAGISTNDSTRSFGYGGELGNNGSYQINYTKNIKHLYYVNTHLNSTYLSAGLSFKTSDKNRLTLRVAELNEDGQNVGTLSYDKFTENGKNYIPRDRKITVGLDETGHKIQRLEPGYLDLTRKLQTFSLSDVWTIDDTHRLHTDAFYIKGNFTNSNFGSTPMKHITKGIKLKYDFNYGKDQKNTALLGLDWYNQNAVLSYDDYRTVNWRKKIYAVKPLHFGYDKTVKALYASNSLVHGKTTFTQGLRFEHVDWGFSRIAAKSEGNGTRKSNDIATQLGVSHRYSDTGRVYAHFETGFTHPDGIQSADDLGKQIIASDVNDETFRNYEIGWSDRLGKTQVNIVGFYSETDNQIDRILALKPTGLLRLSGNIFNTTRKGLDISLTQRFGKLKLKEGYTYLRGHSQMSDNGKAFYTKYEKQGYELNPISLKAVPKHKFIVQAEYKPNNLWTLTASYNYTGSYYNFYEAKNNTPENKVAGYGLFNVDIAYDNHANWKTHFGIRNLTNQKYAYYTTENQGGYYSLIPGDSRTYYATATYSF